MDETTMQAYWWRAENFGDCLTEAICDHYGLPVEHASPYFSQLIGVGSILEHVPADYSGYVLGAGFLHRASQRAFSRARILAARGPLTWERLDRPADCVFGDPGLLAKFLLKSRPALRWKLGIALHYADRESAGLRKIAAQHADEVRWIDVRRPPLEVIHEIAQCQGIVSSSLHGLIVADSLEIPSAWKRSTAVLGEGFKFADHAAAVGATRQEIEFADDARLSEVLHLLTDPPPRALRVAEQLHHLMNELPAILQRDARRPHWPLLRYAGSKVQRFLRFRPTTRAAAA